MNARVASTMAMGAWLWVACSADDGDDSSADGQGSSGESTDTGGPATAGGATTETSTSSTSSSSVASDTSTGTGDTSTGDTSTNTGTGDTTRSSTDAANTGEGEVNGSDDSGAAEAATDGGSTGGVFPEITARPSPGCESAAPLQDGVRDVSVSATLRTYIVSLPEGYDPSIPYPVVFAFHGLGGSGELVSGRFYFGLEEVDATPMIFVYPDGSPVDDQGTLGWADEGGRDVEFFDAMLEGLSNVGCIDLNRVFATGHSYGGVMSHTLGCERSDVLRAVAPVAGALFGGTCGGPIAAWGAHGTNDATVDYYAGVTALDRIMATNGCDRESATPFAPTEYCSIYDCDDGVPVVWCPHEQEHDWPNFASASILDFFERF